MKATTIDRAGTVRCPKCGGTSFSSSRTTKSKVMFGVASLLASPKLRCNGCGHYLKPGSGKSSLRSQFENTQSIGESRAQLRELKSAALERARLQAADPDFDPSTLPNYVWRKAYKQAVAERVIVAPPTRQEPGLEWKTEAADIHVDQAYEARQAATRARYAAKLASPETAEPQGDPLEQLRELGELRELGVLTGEEFDAKKTELLTRL
jgi:hypothetical protein